MTFHLGNSFGLSSMDTEERVWGEERERKGFLTDCHKELKLPVAGKSQNTLAHMLRQLCLPSNSREREN